MPDSAVHGYVLAGGQSSRMGTDKALLSFGTSTLLDRAVTALQVFCSDVTLVGRPSTAARNFRAIPDHVTAAGPVAGVATALADLADRGGQWAFFLPVDVPLLPGELLHSLASLWCSSSLTRIAFPIADDRPQPVISLVHVTALPCLRRSLALDQRRLRSVFEIAATELAGQLAASREEVLRTPALTLQNGAVWIDSQPLAWQPSPHQRQLAHLWFANANTPAELDHLRQAQATIHHPEPKTYTQNPKTAFTG